MVYVKYIYKEKTIKNCTIESNTEITLEAALEAIKYITEEMLYMSKQNLIFVEDLIIEYSFDNVNFVKYTEKLNVK